MKENIRTLTFNEMEGTVLAFGEQKHRASQIFGWLYNKGAHDFSLMTNLPKAFQEKLKERFNIGSFVLEERLVSRDGTEKYLWRLADGHFIESVLIKEDKRKTVCLSTQVGCRVKCSFCASGAKGLIRNLETGEIVDQVMEIQKLSGEKITNIVFMGIGEPLDNYDNVVKSIKIFNDPNGLGIGARKITISTCGIIPGIKKLENLGIQVELSVSLHAPSNATRDKLVPINKKYPLERLTDACLEYYQRTGRVITLEYTLIKDINDSAKDAKDLAEIAKSVKAKVNLIGCNPVIHVYGSSDREEIKKFRNIISSRGITVTVRKSKGLDIMAACGQLVMQREKEAKK